VSGVDGYIIQKYVGKSKSWKTTSTITKNSTTSNKVKNLTTATKYKFRIKTYKIVDSSKIYSSAKVVTACTGPSKVTGLAHKGRGTNYLKLSWKKVSNANGYVIQLWNAKEKKFKTVTTIKDASTTSYKLTGLSANKNYGTAVSGNDSYIRIRAYRTVDKKNYYGTYNYFVNSFENKNYYVTKPKAPSGKTFKDLTSTSAEKNNYDDVCFESATDSKFKNIDSSFTPNTNDSFFWYFWWVDTDANNVGKKRANQTLYVRAKGVKIVTVKDKNQKKHSIYVYSDWSETIKTKGTICSGQ
jgi:hypothetical protein